MKIHPECVPCLLNRILYETMLISSVSAHKTMKKALKILSNMYDESLSSVQIATEVHRETYKILGENDPYKEMKKRSTKVAKELIPFAERLLNESKNRRESSGILAVVGNLLDFGIIGAISSPEALKKDFFNFYHQGLDVNHLPQSFELIENVKNPKVLYFTDNAGEVVFDRFLIEEIKKTGAVVYLVLKGVPILTDATIVEAQESGLLQIADGYYETPTFYVGVEVKKLRDKLKKAMEEATLVVYKGMANFEAVSEPEGDVYRPRLFLMRAKCDPVASSLGVKKGQNIAILQR